MTTVWIRRPTAPPVPETAAPTFTVDAPARGPPGRDPHRRRLALLAPDRGGLGGAAARATAWRTSPPSRPTGRSARPARPTAATSTSSPARSTSRSSGSARAARARRSRSPTRSTSSEHEQPGGRGRAPRSSRPTATTWRRHLGHGDLQGARAAVPARGATRRGAAADRGRVLPAGARAARRGDGMTLDRRAGRGPGRSRAAFYELSLAEQWGDGAPLLPPTDDAIEALLAATPYPADHVVGVLPPGNGVATVELVAVNAAMAGVEPAAFPLVLAALEALLGARVERVRAHDDDVERVPDAASSTGRRRDDARHRLPRRLHGRRRRPGLDDDRPGGRRCACATSAASARARRRAPCSASPRASGCASASGRSARRGRRSPSGAASRADQDVVTVHGGKGTFPLADIHNDDARDLLYLIAKSLAYPLANMFLGNARERRGRARDQPDVGRAVRRGVPRRRATCRRSCTSTRGSRSTCGRTPNQRDPARRRAASTTTAGCTSSRRPDQIVPIVCGGLGSLHAIALPSFGESQMQSAAGRAGAADRWTATRSPPRSTRSAGSCAPTAPTSCCVEANPKTLRVRLALVLDDVSLRGLRPPARRARARRSTPSMRAPGPGRVRARARRPPPRDRMADRRRRNGSGARWSRCTSRCCATSSHALERDAGIDSGVVLRARVPRPGRRAGCGCGELHGAHARRATASPASAGWCSAWRRDGLVERRIDPDDRRGTVVSLTRGRAHAGSGGRTTSTTAALDEHLGRRPRRDATVSSLARARSKRVAAAARRRTDVT